MGGYISQNSLPTDFLNATGSVKVGMTNDYMFRAVLQECNEALVALICSVLHLSRDTVHSAEITNPIILGNHLGDKEVILDVNVFFDDSRYINLEMQIANRGNWFDRSLYYLCRGFTHLNRGQDYIDVLPVTHIGFLDYTLFEDETDFFASYLLSNPVTGKIYSDKLRVVVLNLTKIGAASAEDRRFGIDTWAKLFKARTWEEIRMLATQDKAISKAASSIYALSADEAVMWECEARADAAKCRNDEAKLRERLEQSLARAEEDKARAEEDKAKAESLLKQYRQVMLEHGLDPDLMDTLGQ